METVASTHMSPSYPFLSPRPGGSALTSGPVDDSWLVSGLYASTEQGGLSWVGPPIPPLTTLVAWMPLWIVMGWLSVLDFRGHVASWTAPGVASRGGAWHTWSEF